MNREILLSKTFVELADSLVDDFDLVDLMVRLAERSIEFTQGSAAGLLLLDGHGGLRLIATTNEAIETVEIFQIQNDEGPCRDCCRTGAPVIADDLTKHAERWPRFVPDALAAGYRSVHAFPLRLRGSTLGALGVFRHGTDGLGQDDADVAQALADVATIAVLQSRAVDNAQSVAAQLHHALDSRIIIEQAKGVLAATGGMSMDVAFTTIRSYARRNNRRLTDVARDITRYTLSVGDLSG